MSDLMSPGRRIRHYRMLRGMTQKALGIAAGFPPETADIRIAQYESGARTPKHALLCALADALGVLPSALDIPHIKSREVLNQLLLALEDEYGLTVTITENNERSICNTVSFVDGIKYHRTKKDYHDMQTVSDELCREYRLSVIENPQYGKAKQYGEWRAEQEQRPTWRGLIRADIDEAIRQSMTERQFFDNLRKKGYEVKIGKDISVRPPGKERFVRLIRNFGEDYSIEQIRRRILSQTRAEKKPSEPTRQVIRIRLFGSLKKTRKITGFRALYFHYCYLLGIFPKNKPKQNRRRLHFLLREDLRKLDDITAETRLLVRNRIDTAEQLFSYRDEAQDKIAALTAERKQLYKLQRTAAVKADPEKSAEIKDRISALSKELATLRKEVSLCDDIAERSGVIKEKIKAVREDEHIKGKEKTDHVQFR